MNKDSDCPFCDAPEQLRDKACEMQQGAKNAAAWLLRRWGFPARDSFDLHCASLKAALNNAPDKNQNTNTPQEAQDDIARGCLQKLRAGAAAFVGGLNVVGREEFDAYNQMLAAAETAAQKTKTRRAKK